MGSYLRFSLVSDNLLYPFCTLFIIFYLLALLKQPFYSEIMLVYEHEDWDGNQDYDDYDYPEEEQTGCSCCCCCNGFLKIWCSFLILLIFVGLPGYFSYKVWGCGYHMLRTGPGSWQTASPEWVKNNPEAYRTLTGPENPWLGKIIWTSSKYSPKATEKPRSSKKRSKVNGNLS